MRGLTVRNAALGAGETAVAVAPEVGIMSVCQRRDDSAACGTRIASQDSVRARPWWGSSVTRTRAYSPSPDGQKNGLRDVRTRAAWLVRPQAAPRPRSGLRGPAHLPRGRSQAGGLPVLWHGAAGTARLPCRQP